MRVYHISETLREGDVLEGGHGRFDRLAEPFLQALEMGPEWLQIMVLQGKYLYQVLGRSGLREWANYAKWSTEAVFEYIRRTEFPCCPCRLASCFYYDSEVQCRRYYQLDWGEASAKERENVHLFAIELEDPAPQRFDMNLYDLAYEAMEMRQDLAAVQNLARQYFSGEETADPVWEIVSNCPAKAIYELASGDNIEED